MRLYAGLPGGIVLVRDGTRRPCGVVRVVRDCPCLARDHSHPAWAHWHGRLQIAHPGQVVSPTGPDLSAVLPGGLRARTPHSWDARSGSPLRAEDPATRCGLRPLAAERPEHHGSAAGSTRPCGERRGLAVLTPATLS